MDLSVQFLIHFLSILMLLKEIAGVNRSGIRPT